MTRPTPLKALKFFKAKFPNATWMDAALIIGSMRMINTLLGAYHGARLDNLEKKGQLLEGAAQEEWDRVERMFGPRAEVNDILKHFFGVDRDEQHFDPADLSDYLNHSATADGLFNNQKTAEIAQFLGVPAAPVKKKKARK